jgi:hypothetical protein
MDYSRKLSLYSFQHFRFTTCRAVLHVPDKTFPLTVDSASPSNPENLLIKQEFFIKKLRVFSLSVLHVAPGTKTDGGWKTSPEKGKCKLLFHVFFSWSEKDTYVTLDPCLKPLPRTSLTPSDAQNKTDFFIRTFDCSTLFSLYIYIYMYKKRSSRFATFSSLLFCILRRQSIN